MGLARMPEVSNVESPEPMPPDSTQAEKQGVKAGANSFEKTLEIDAKIRLSISEGTEKILREQGFNIHVNEQNKVVIWQTDNKNQITEQKYSNEEPLSVKEIILGEGESLHWTSKSGKTNGNTTGAEYQVLKRLSSVPEKFIQIVKNSNTTASRE